MIPRARPRLGRVLAIRAGALGDTILALPAIRALAGQSDHLELIGTAPYTELALGRGLAETVHAMDRARFRGFFEDLGDDALASFLEGFDLVVAWARLPLLGRTTRGLGIRSIEATPHPPPGIHASDHLIQQLAPLGIDGPAPPPRVEADTGPFELRSVPGSYLAIHPSSGSRNKNWPREHFLALARQARSAGLEVLWIQGEADEEVVRELVDADGGSVADRLPLKALAGILARSAVFVGNDSGVSHLAAAVGAPTLALFGPSDPRQWAPRGPIVRVGSLGASPAQVWGFAREIMTGR